MRLASWALCAGSLAVALTGCGSSQSSPPLPPVPPAKPYRLAALNPRGPIRPGQPVTVSFRIVLPSGKTLTTFKRGSGPHTGVHVILVRDDLSVIVHRHPKVAPDGVVRQSITLPKPGRYLMLVDIYPNIPGSPSTGNFQLRGHVTVSGVARTIPLPAYSPEVTLSSYRVRMLKPPRFSVNSGAYLTNLLVQIRDIHGRKPHLQTWYGALAHAIFFRSGDLEYFHTHICAPNAPGCASLVSRSLAHNGSASGLLRFGVLLGSPGRWRLFVQFKVKGHVLTAPFTLNVH